jgi:hypothetical protein
LSLGDLADRFQEHLPVLLEDRPQQRVFVPEVMVDEAVSDARLFSDVGDATPVIALVGKDADGGLQDVAAPLVFSDDRWPFIAALGGLVTSRQRLCASFTRDRFHRRRGARTRPRRGFLRR